MSVNDTFPMGRNKQAYLTTAGAAQGYHDGWGQSGGLLLYTEQQQLYNAINITLGPYQVRNSTFPGVGISTLWCPSDGQITNLRYFEQSAGWDGTTIGICYTSYNGCQGTFTGNSGNTTYLAAMNGMFPDQGTPLIAGGPLGQSPVRIASVTDGTSNTILFGEHAQGKYNQVGCDGFGDWNFEGSGWWADADYGDSSFVTTYPMNMPQGDQNVTFNSCDQRRHVCAFGVELPLGWLQLRLRGRLGEVPQELDLHLELSNARPRRELPPRRRHDARGLPIAVDQERRRSHQRGPTLRRVTTPRNASQRAGTIHVPAPRIPRPKEPTP